MAKFKGAVLQCQTCGSEFKVPPSRAHKAKYCGNACAGVGRGKARLLPRVAVVCKWCGKTFLSHQCHAHRRIYCSYECKHADPTYSALISSHTAKERNGSWDGGVTIHSGGYVYEHCPEHPLSKYRYVFQHRLVMERHLRETQEDSPHLVKVGEKLYLDPEVVVHHKDGDRTNNDISNLQVMTNGDHVRLHNEIRRNKGASQ